MSDEPQQDPQQGAQSPPTPSLYKTAWGLYLVLAIAGVLWLGGRQGAPPLSAFLQPSALGIGIDIAWGLAAGSALLAVWWLASKLIGGLRRLEDDLSAMLAGLDTSEAVALALISGFAEELFFRGAMQQNLGFAPAVLIFGLLHVGPTRNYLWWTAFAVGAGALFGWLVLERGTLLPAMLAHVLVNGVNLWRLARRAATGRPVGDGAA